jgi:hypothetical protein
MTPRSWTERRKAFRERSGPVSNPGQPSPVNRPTRRAAYFAAWDEALTMDRTPEPTDA